MNFILKRVLNFVICILKSSGQNKHLKINHVSLKIKSESGLSHTRNLLAFVSSSGQDSILEPLCFPEQPADGASTPSLQGPSVELLVCLFCLESVPLQQKDVLLKHLLLEHKLVIADVRLVADLPKYVCPKQKSATHFYSAGCSYWAF